MKNRMIVFVLGAVALLFGASVSHAITVQDTTKSTASVTTGGSKASNVSIFIRDTDAPFGTNRSSVTWTNVNPGDGYKIADELIVVIATVTDSGGAVRTYYDNGSASANPKYVGTGDAAGLLEDDGTGSTSASPLPTAWSIKSSTKDVGSADVSAGIQASNPQTGAATGSGNRFQWLNHLDRTSAAFSDTNKFTWTHNVTGIHFGQADTEFGAHADGAEAYMYIEADYTNAAAAQAYKSSELVVESFLE